MILDLGWVRLYLNSWRSHLMLLKPKRGVIWCDRLGPSHCVLVVLSLVSTPSLAAYSFQCKLPLPMNRFIRFLSTRIHHHPLSFVLIFLILISMIFCVDCYVSLCENVESPTKKPQGGSNPGHMEPSLPGTLSLAQPQPYGPPPQALSQQAAPLVPPTLPTATATTSSSTTTAGTPQTITNNSHHAIQSHHHNSSTTTNTTTTTSSSISSSSLTPRSGHTSSHFTSTSSNAPNVVSSAASDRGHNHRANISATAANGERQSSQPSHKIGQKQSSSKQMVSIEN